MAKKKPQHLPHPLLLLLQHPQLHRLLPLHPLTPLQLQRLPQRQRLLQQPLQQPLLPSDVRSVPASAGTFMKKPRCAGFFFDLGASAKFSGDQFEDPLGFAGGFGLAIGAENPDQGLT